MQSTQDFATKHNLTLKAARADRNPNMPDFNGDHWKCRLKNETTGATATIYFSKGSAYNGTPPDAAEVLDCLARDAATIENCRDFSDFCDELGYDEDSRKAEKTYKATVKQTDKLKSLTGHTYDELLYDTERD